MEVVAQITKEPSRSGRQQTPVSSKRWDSRADIRKGKAILWPTASLPVSLIRGGQNRTHIATKEKTPIILVTVINLLTSVFTTNIIHSLQLWIPYPLPPISKEVFYKTSGARFQSCFWQLNYKLSRKGCNEADSCKLLHYVTSKSINKQWFQNTWICNWLTSVLLRIIRLMRSAVEKQHRTPTFVRQFTAAMIS
jgi:hypothetical protein